ncbi:MAG: YfhO family protein [Oscillospiraceae bacterium]|nr:YfhO family protein [Oscillospiraceae bacterium]
MKLPEIDRKLKWNYVGLAFAIPTCVMLVVLIVCGYEPFGQYSLLYSDMYHQYYPFFFAFRKALLSGESLLWNWSAGMGMDYLGLISYYLASPLNLLSVLVPEGWVLEYFSLLMPIKLGLASGFFAIMLKKAFNVDDLSITLFGCFYGMCAWALGYQWNIMWLDTFALLPLVMLGAVQLLRDKKFVLYTLSLFLAVFANYYVGFFVCIFVFLFFFCYELCRFKSVGRFLADFGRIAVFSMLAIGMTAILELPALAALQNTQSSVNTFPEGFAVNIVSGEAVTAAKSAWNEFKAAKEAGTEDFNLWWTAIKASIPPLTDAMKQVAGNMGGGIEPTFKDGLPNLYCGVFPIALGFLFLLSKDVKFRDKLCCVGLLIFFMLSFILRQLDYIWHGFHFTNQIPYRFSFLFSFVLLYMAYRVWLLRHSFQIWQIIMAGSLSILLLACSKYRDDVAFLAFNLSFLGLYLVCMIYAALEIKEEPEDAQDDSPAPAMQELTADEILGQPEEPIEEEELPVLDEIDTVELIGEPVEAFDDALPTEEVPEEEEKKASRLFTKEERCRQAALAIAFVMLLELVLNVANFAARFPATYAANYPNGTEYAESMIKVMQELEDDNLFYRAETTHSQTLNDGALNSYYGISTFTSSANVKVTEFMRCLGYAAKNTYNRYVFEEASPVSNLFLGLKYMLERNGNVEENAYFDELHTYGKVTLLENNAYLPLGFLAESGLSEVEFAASVNNYSFQNRLFSAATGIDEDVWDWLPAGDLTVTGNNVNTTVSNASGYTSYKATASGGSLTYSYTVSQDGFMCIDVNFPKRNSFSVYKGDALLYTESVSLAQMFSVCDVKAGDEISIVIKCGANENSNVTVRAATIRDDVFRRGYDVLNASTLQLTECTTTKVAGVIDCNRDGLLYTSVPQNGNWLAYVDGQPAEITLVGDVMVGLELTEGVHTIELRYENAAFEVGTILSMLCLLIFLILVAADWALRRRKNK